MGVDQLPSGSCRARLMIDGKTYTATFATEAEAGEWVVVTRGRVVEGRAIRSLTVEECARRWLGGFIDVAADVDRYRRDVVEHILPTLGSRRLVEVTPAEIAALLEQVGTTASAVAAEQLRTTLRELFADAVDEGVIARSPVPASRRRAQEVRIY
jgi:hypothetical protein